MENLILISIAIYLAGIPFSAWFYGLSSKKGWIFDIENRLTPICLIWPITFPIVCIILFFLRWLPDTLERAFKAGEIHGNSK